MQAGGGGGVGRKSMIWKPRKENVRNGKIRNVKPVSSGITSDFCFPPYDFSVFSWDPQ